MREQPQMAQPWVTVPILAGADDALFGDIKEGRQR
jgi:hypothetical protein